MKPVNQIESTWLRRAALFVSIPVDFTVTVFGILPQYGRLFAHVWKRRP